MSDTKIGVVGGGNWGKNHIRTLHEMGALGAVVELDAGLREALESEYPDVAIYNNLETVLAGGEGVPACSGFVIATPAHVHYPIGIQCLEAGKGVLIEKPMTLDSAESEKLVEAAGGGGSDFDGRTLAAVSASGAGDQEIPRFRGTRNVAYSSPGSFQTG